MTMRALRSLLLLAGLLTGAWPIPTSAQSTAPATNAAPSLPPYLRQDLYPKWIDDKVQIKWPPHNGCAAAPVSETLAPGTLIDRFGSENGTFFSPKGESFDARALPYVCSQMVYTVYRVTKPLHVATCQAAPWFDAPGGATQFETDDPAFKLREGGAIEVVPNDTDGNAKPVSPCGSP
jgi:hypothetical protein